MHSIMQFAKCILLLIGYNKNIIYIYVYITYTNSIPLSEKVILSFDKEYRHTCCRYISQEILYIYKRNLYINALEKHTFAAHICD